MTKKRPVCKYGHRKSGKNLLLRPRVEKITRSWTNKNGSVTTKTYERRYVERVCVTCLNNQRRKYKMKIRSKDE